MRGFLGFARNDTVSGRGDCGHSAGLGVRITAEDRQRQQQIPFGNDSKRGKGNCSKRGKGNCSSRFPSGMTARGERACLESAGALDGADDGLGLVAALGVLGLGDGVGDDAGAGLDVALFAVEVEGAYGDAAV